MEMTVDSAQVLLADRDDRHVLDVWVPLAVVGAHMMHIMCIFPPSQTDTLSQIANDKTNGRVQFGAVCHSIVAQIVSNEGDLLPKHTEHERGDDGEDLRVVIVGQLEEIDDAAQHRDQDEHFLGVVSVRSLKPALFHQLIVQHDEVLGQRVVFSFVLLGLQVADVHAREILVSNPWAVVQQEGQRRIFAAEAFQQSFASGMLQHPFTHIVHFAFNLNPAILAKMVLGEFLACDHFGGGGGGGGAAFPLLHFCLRSR